MRSRLRLKRDVKLSPSVGVIDSQNVKTTKTGDESRGVDRGAKIKGLKRHIVTDTQGLLLVLKVHSANEHDNKSKARILEQLRWRFERMKKDLCRWALSRRTC